MTPPETYRPLDIASGVRVNADRFPGRTAVRQGERSLTYGAMAARMNRVTHACLAAGVAADRPAAIVAGNLPEYFEIVAGASATGGPIATVNPRQTEGELRAILEDCEARVVFADPAFEEVIRAAAPAGAEVVVLGEPYEAWIGRASDAEPGFTPPEWATFAIPYTSGTTGRPKGVCLSHRSRTVSFMTYGSIYGCFSEDDRFLVTTPLFHGGGFAFPMATLWLGGEVELMTAPGPEPLARTIAEGRHSGTFVVPTQFHGMFDLPAPLRDGLSRHGFRAVICNAAPLPEETKLEALDRLGEGVLHETYGSTEGGVITNLAPKDMRRKVNCAGRAAVGQRIRLLDDAGRAVPVGEVGELFSNSAVLFNGYWKRPEETAAGFRDGWFSAGDLARRDEEGFHYIVDRKKDMILSGGVNIYPRDIEETLYAHPGVAEAAVVGLPDPRWGEAVCAFVRATPGAGTDAAAAESILAWCRDRLAPHKRPKEVRFIEAIPRNAAGKVLKKDLRAAATG